MPFISNREKLVAIFAALIFATIYFAPTFPKWNNIGGVDWDNQFADIEVQRMSVVQDFAFPFWNPYECGGVPSFANPRSVCLAPWFPLLLIFGTLSGLKISMILMLALGLFFAYLVAREWKLSVPASILAAGITMLNTTYPLHITTGNIEWLANGLIPLCFWSYRHAIVKNSMKFLIITSLTLAAMVLSGALYQPFFSAFLLLIYSIALIITKRKVQPIKFLIIVGVMALSFTFLKTSSMIELSARTPKYSVLPVAFGALSWEAIPYAFLNRNNNHTFLKTGNFDILSASCKSGEYANYIGIVSVILFFVGLLFQFRNYKSLWLTFFIMFILWLGPLLPFNIWGLLNKLPMLSVLRIPARTMCALSLLLGIGAAVGLDFFYNSFNNNFKFKFFKPFRWVIMLFVIIDLGLLANSYWDLSFYLKMPKRITNAPFKQINGNDLNYPNQFNALVCNQPCSTMIPALYQNCGVVRAYENLTTSRNAIPADSPLYKGEAFFANGATGKITSISVKINEWIIEGIADSPGLLSINQNFYPGWHEKLNGVLENHGLISSPIPAGHFVRHFVFKPTSLNMGFLGTFAGILFAFALFFSNKKIQRLIITFTIILLVFSLFISFKNSKLTSNEKLYQNTLRAAQNLLKTQNILAGKKKENQAPIRKKELKFATQLKKLYEKSELVFPYSYQIFYAKTLASFALNDMDTAYNSLVHRRNLAPTSVNTHSKFRNFAYKIKLNEITEAVILIRATEFNKAKHFEALMATEIGNVF